MHNLFLGELRHHCREVWGIDIKDKSSDSTKVKSHSPEEQRTELQRVYAALLKKSENALKKIRKGYVVAVAEVNGILPQTGNFTKAAYMTALVQWVIPIILPAVLEEDTRDFHVAKGPHDISKYRVLDQATINQVREDISATYFPSWMERPPRNFGSPSHGKLKADQWRTVCTVSLVITLCRVWGAPGALDKHRLLLENFVCLVCAVDLATRRTMDPKRIRKFDSYMLRYLTTLRELFGHRLVPNHHMSLHLWECLSLFGPVHAWWVFPFERYNGLLANLNTNSQSDKMPLTFMRYFYIGANIRWLMNTIKWVTWAPFQRMVAAYIGAVSKKKTASGVRVADYVPYGTEDDPSHVPTYDEGAEVPLSDNEYKQLFRLLSPSGNRFASARAPSRTSRPILNDRVNFIGSIDRAYMTFAMRDAGLRNSFVLFTDSGEPQTDGSFPRAGQISKIFIHGRKEDDKLVQETFFLVDEYQPLAENDTVRDPYRRFPDLDTRLFYDSRQARSALRLVRFQDIQCHFAARFCSIPDIKKNCVVVRSLNRVRHPLEALNVGTDLRH
ncbi:hypothetical protein OH76DRAFT_1357452 [Lentinus brumalis]|uniref:DUF4218 domain-containing protein n=1 Tax=Lentinus brumalis TaxID=2498619 RepID=A0A371CZ95_9APHY|nr:hypothetical protein OH76DRAFT_1357452 [Polyporus brumalis]